MLIAISNQLVELGFPAKEVKEVYLLTNKDETLTLDFLIGKSGGVGGVQVWIFMFNFCSLSDQGL